jgi:hypothetical protein
MSNNMSLYSPTSLPTTRSGNVKLPAIVRNELTGLQNQTIVQAARIQAVEYVTSEAMHAVVGLSELEGQLAALSPMSTTRLQVIGNLASLQIARIVHG